MIGIKIIIDICITINLDLLLFYISQLSWPDLYFVSILDHLKSIINVDLVDGRPHLTALKHKVLDIPQIKSWIAKRPKSLL